MGAGRAREHPRPLLGEGELGAALEAATALVARRGIHVPEERFRHQVVTQAGHERGERVCFTPGETQGFLERWRARQGTVEETPPLPAGARRKLDLSVMPYAHTYLDPASGQLTPLTTRALERATRFLGTLHGEGVEATVPGYAVDVPAALQPLVQYKTGARYNPAGGGYGWLGEPETARYLLAMAEAMGRPIRATVVYVTSPLRLGGMELRTAVALKDRLDWLAVGDMGCCGATFPLDPQAALALAWAETLAAAQCLEALTGLPVDWGGSVEPFDLRAGTIPFGAPEQVLYYRMTREARQWLSGRASGGCHHPLLTMAKRPGEQASLEKMGAAATAVAWGCDSLGAAGSLSMDEVFSPAQVLLDRELRDWLEPTTVEGLAGTREADELVAQVLQDETGQGYLGAERTVAGFREASWQPRLLRREALATWRAAGRPTAAEAAQSEARERLEAADWELDGERLGKLEAVYEEARRELG